MMAVLMACRARPSLSRMLCWRQPFHFPQHGILETLLSSVHPPIFISLHIWIQYHFWGLHLNPTLLSLFNPLDFISSYSARIWLLRRG
jgi:hypothetical protein